MPRRTLARAHTLRAAAWSHPYRTGPFDPYLYADGGDGDGSGSGSGDGAAGGDGGQSGQSSDGSGQQSGQASAQASTQGAPAGEDPAATIKRLEKEASDARKEAAKDRTAAKAQAADDAVKALTEKLAKALGLVAEDTPPDPKALAAAIAQKDVTIADQGKELQAKDVELAVWARADKAGARAAALLDSRSFVTALAALDPSAKGFTTALDDAIKAAVKANPQFASATVASASGSDLSGGTGEGSTRQRPTSLSAAVRSTFGT
ncbi:hypothetical protein LG634_24650 [Streptomyces bambusae]|uniref:hypothetical protein n=1 Tax=Streptomyces bambusae TaxID=1550616 RepID=UPI001CFF0C95|nr:hypothetical protein [Streptomyces bambusae]MCB5168004.1 hypothetical protein [Streptomyces bambusae]